MKQEGAEVAMKLLETGLVAAIIIAGTACGASTQRTSSTVARGASCNQLQNLDQQVAQLYDTSRVKHAEPIYTERFLARAIQPRELVGAELFVNAEPGVSQPYLERVLSCHAAQASSNRPNDPLSTENISNLAVRVQGGQFVIAVTGADRQASQQIWQKAQALLKSGGHIEVQQLSAADSKTAL
jgi:hypothetical protein